MHAQSAAQSEMSLIMEELNSHFGGRRVVNEKQLSDFIGKAPATTMAMRKAGLGPRHFKLSVREIGYLVIDIAAWLLEGRGAPVEPARRVRRPTPTAAPEAGPSAP